MKHLKHLIPPLVVYAAKAFILAEANPFKWSQADREGLIWAVVSAYALLWGIVEYGKFRKQSQK